jgi:hypothetical protein
LRLLSIVTRTAAAHGLRLLAVAGFALALGACSKCDVPDFWHRDAPAAPQSCHDGAAAK